MTSLEELPEPRLHHYVFAHHWVPRFAQSNPSVFFGLFSSADGHKAMVSFWETVGESLSPEQRMPSDGLEVHVAALHTGLRALMVKLPHARAMSEAWFIAAIESADPSGQDVPVFSLQYAWDVDAAREETAVAAWDGESFGIICPGPEPTLEAWTSWLRLRFVPLPN